MLTGNVGRGGSFLNIITLSGFPVTDEQLKDSEEFPLMASVAARGVL